MTNATNDNTSRLNAVVCLVMAKIVSQTGSLARGMFWETLLNSRPDMTAYLPALTTAVRERKTGDVLRMLLSHPSPIMLSAEAVRWRPELVAALEDQRKASRKLLDEQLLDRQENWSGAGEDEYKDALKGLTQVDKCGMPPGMTCPSVLPTLLGEAYHVNRSCQMSMRLECLDILAGWRPAPNVMTDLLDMDEWADFWLKLYSKERLPGSIVPGNDSSILLQGIAAKALLNLMETGGKEKNRIPMGLETRLLESLTMAADVAGKVPRSDYNPGWLSWQPQDITRFPADRLVKLPETLLKRAKLLCQEPGSWDDDNWWDGTLDELERKLSATLEELVRWDRAGWLAKCHINLAHRIATDVSGYLDTGIRENIPTGYLLSQRLYRWFVQGEMSTFKEGKELLQKLKKRWCFECNSKYGSDDSLFIAWDGRIQLQRTGLAIETPATFHKNLLKTIKNERPAGARMALSGWRPEKDTSDKARRAWKRFWQQELKSDNTEISRTAALALLRPDAADDPVDSATRWRNLRDVLLEMPKHIRPQLSAVELAHLMGELPMGNPNADFNPTPNRTGQFKPETTRFRIPTEPAAPASTPANVRTASANRTAQRTTENELRTGRCYR